MTLTTELDNWKERAMWMARQKQELMLFKAQYEELSTSKVEKSLIRIKQSY